MVLVKKGTKSVQYFLNYELLFELNEISCHDPPRPRGRNELERSGAAEASDAVAIKGDGSAARSGAKPAHCLLTAHTLCYLFPATPGYQLVCLY